MARVGRSAPARDSQPCYPGTCAGAALPAVTDDTYLRKVIAAGGFRAYQRNHLNALVASFAPKLPRRLPQEMVRRVVKYAFHVGYY